MVHDPDGKENNNEDDGNGFCIWMKKLEKGIFPFISDGKEEITRKELYWLLSGIDMRKKHTVVTFSG